jgi:transposase
MEQYTDRVKVLARNKRAFVGIDVHKLSWYVTILVDGAEVFSGRLEAEYWRLRRLFERLPGCSITVAYEAGCCGFGLYDLLDGDSVACCVVAPSLIAVAPGKRVKVDRIDSRRLAQDLADRRLQPVFVLDPEQRAHRDLVRTRDQIAAHKRDLMRQIKAKLLFHGISGPSARAWSAKYRLGLRGIEYPFPALKTSILALLDLLETLMSRVRSLDREIRELAQTERYRSNVAILKSVPGIGPLTAMIILTELGDISRFPSHDDLSGFLGLVPSEFTTGFTQHRGHITQAGNTRVRKALVESAWTLIRYDAGLRRKFTEICARVGSKKAIVAIARSLAGRIRRILLHSETYVCSD